MMPGGQKEDLQMGNIQCKHFLFSFSRTPWSGDVDTTRRPSCIGIEKGRTLDAESAAILEGPLRA